MIKNILKLNYGISIDNREILIKEVDEFLIALENGAEVVYIPSIIHMNGKCIGSVSTDVGTIIREYNKKVGGDVQDEE